MPKYRVFRLDDAGKVNGPSMSVKYANDQEAIRELRKKTLDGSTLEIWDLQRRVAIIRADESITRHCAPAKDVQSAEVEQSPR